MVPYVAMLYLAGRLNASASLTAACRKQVEKAFQR
jgi:hypothetical protein